MGDMANLFLGPILTKIIDTFFNYLEDQLRWQAGMKEEMERLRNNNPKIRALVSHVNQEDIIDKNPALNDWIWQLRDAIDEAEDLFDDFEYMRHAEQLVSNTDEEEANVRPFKSFISASLDNLRRFGERALHIDPYLKRLVEVVQKLDKVSGEFSAFLHLVDNTKLEEQQHLVELHRNRETGSLPTNVLIGRSDDKEFVLQWLLEQQQSSNEEHQTSVSTITLYRNISLLSIVGDGGMGKTTLLQHVYKDEMTKEFALKIWVCVSNNFDVKKVITGMLESLIGKDHNLESLDALQSKLESEVKFKKFLLVLDDIWENNEGDKSKWEDEEGDKSKWEKVIAPLAGGGLGSKILITTRMESVASMIAKVIKKKKEVRRLKGLKEGECLNLLITHAFVGVDNPDDHKKLRYIAEKSVKKLSGSPLAAKVMGSVLNFDLDERHWRKVLNNNLNQNGIFSILKLSYTFLPKHLQNCFAFCSIFPKDYDFDKDYLVRMWIAVGFIQPCNSQEDTLEDIGKRYFDVLVNKSFFDKVTEYNKTYYKMHDLLHDLAQFVSKQECFRDEGDEELLLRIPETIRHLSIKFGSLKVLGKMGRFKNLRTLRIHINYDKIDQDCADTFNEIFKVTRSIRLLELQPERSHKIPNVILEPIEYLKHLRFLWYEFSITQLPRSLTKLYHLQFIICRDFCFGDNDDLFPRDMNNLSNLRYLSHPRLKFHGIGKLVFLQELKQFYVKNEIGYKIDELKHMNDLYILRINYLENMRDATEACNAKLCYKKKLTYLSLNWTDSIYEERNIVNHDLDERVLDNLQPYKHLKELNMSSYNGVRSAVWMNKANLIENLEKIELCKCLEWQILPPFGHLPFLKILRIQSMPKVKRFDNKFHGNDKYCDFPSLETLEISDSEALQDWFDASVDYLFPCLTTLRLYNCPNLQELPYLPPKLKALTINNIGWKTLNCCSISKSIPLKTLFVRSCQNISFISLVGEIGTFAMLEEVKIIDCPNSITLLDNQELEAIKNCQLIIDKLIISDSSVLHIELLRSVTSVRELTFEKVNELISFSFEAERCFMQVSSLIRRLNFISLRSLQSLPSILTSFSSLEIVEVSHLPQLQELPDLPDSLELLKMHDLESLQCLPSSLSTVSSLKHLILESILLLKSLPDLPASLELLQMYNLQSLQRLPSSLSTICTLKFLKLANIPLLKSLPDLPASVERLELSYLDSLQWLPSSLSTISSLTHLELRNIMLLKSLPELPPSLCTLYLRNLDSLECLPSCLSSLSSLKSLTINKVPLLRELSNLPPSLTLYLKECDPELKKRYKHVSQDLSDISTCTIH